MSTEEKIAEIRQQVAERARNKGAACKCSRCLAAHCRKGVVIYGVPLEEEEIVELRDLVIDHRFRFGFSWAERYPNLSAIWEMLERGKR
jgi:hypothetical protein